MGQKKIKPFFAIWPLILRKVARSSLFLKRESRFAWCRIWHMAEVRHGGLQIHRRAPTYGGEGCRASTLLLFTLSALGLESELQSRNCSKSDVIP